MLRTQTIRKLEEKKHSVRYDAVDDAIGNIVTSIYIRKGALPPQYPSELTLTLEWKD